MSDEMKPARDLIRSYLAAKSRLDRWEYSGHQYRGVVRARMVARDRRALEQAESELCEFAECDALGRPVGETGP